MSFGDQNNNYISSSRLSTRQEPYFSPIFPLKLHPLFHSQSADEGGADLFRTQKGGRGVLGTRTGVSINTYNESRISKFDDQQIRGGQYGPGESHHYQNEPLPGFWPIEYFWRIWSRFLPSHKYEHICPLASRTLQKTYSYFQILRIFQTRIFCISTNRI